ncbi:hypothetical protein A3I40_02120 [Candidatus Uhrbacteria bacterium RIFCSPLOWO2_02_FULL_48_12]|uniref:Hydrogenase maturation protease n=1 Tax=Candidatus Uhrbacteria bacterium RIFCSPLOWO2_02_FULL_48_12 TaxID=1802407 RepID=A0A1F7VAE3_9BACT|nr:MAG: hypothetical protein A3I40_02120 [Candidatus Uhrbacteria bacterium RIFCSPLOWO2_02_FULL_48_12]
MKVYIFGNEDLAEDNRAFEVAKQLRASLRGIEFIKVKPNEDLPFANEGRVIIMDTVWGIKNVEVLGNQDLDRLALSPRASVHDFDLGWQLKYLKKLGKLGEVIIIGLPMQGEIDYRLIHSIFKKLVAQDIQGS